MNVSRRLGLEFLIASAAGLVFLVAPWVFLKQPAPVYPGFWMLAWLCVFSPILEELAFRGFLQTEINRFFFRVKFRITLGNFLGSALFGLLHCVLYKNIALLLVIFPSLIFGYFKDRSGSVTLPILLHVFYNAGYFGLFGVGFFYYYSPP